VLVVSDCDHDSLREITYATGTTEPADPPRWEMWEARPGNRFELVIADTGSYPYPREPVTGNFMPLAAGDVDGDACADLVGVIPWDENGMQAIVLAVLESAASDSLPRRVSWATDHGQLFADIGYIADLDQDSAREVICYGPRVYESVGNDSCVRVWGVTLGYHLAIGDYDQDGLVEMVSGAHMMRVIENVVLRQDTYQVVFADSQAGFNGYDTFDGGDIDGDGKPEFFVRFANRQVDGLDHRLYVYEADADNSYIRALVASEVWPELADSRSSCGDLDGDGRNEVVWCLPQSVRVLACTGNNSFQEVWRWTPDHGSDGYGYAAHVADLNRNGYNELVVGGWRGVSVFEVEGVRVLNPNGGQSLVPGETCAIRWRLFTPPRCDSVTLVLVRDSVAGPETIASGIAPSESSFAWVVPAGPQESCRVMAVAHGPGVLFDESDSAFSILPGGIGEASRGPVRSVGLWVGSNPLRSEGRVRYDAPGLTGVELDVLDPCGRVVRRLVSGVIPAGRYTAELGRLPAGVYIIRLAAAGRVLRQKLVVAD
jgi:hypothetical protein